MAEQTPVSAEVEKAPEFKVFVGNLPFTTTDDSLAALFQDKCNMYFFFPLLTSSKIKPN